VSLVESLGLALLRRVDPERAHGLALRALTSGLALLPGPVTSARLACTLAGMPLLNPVGLAAGFDKNATAVAQLCRAGFGFVEVGAATPLPQPGNPKPRLFRLAEDRAAINRFGFNNDGADAIAARLAARPRGPVPVGLNLGANKTSDNRAADFARVLATCGPHVDFATVNVSSPNTEKLRDLQGPAALAALLAGVMEARTALARPIPVFLKIAPDLSWEQIDEVLASCAAAGIAGLIATNTTLGRDGLAPSDAGLADQAGGLSGAPLTARALEVVRYVAEHTGLPVIGAGGIMTADGAQRMFDAGAALIQLYTGFIYHGPGLIAAINAADTRRYPR